MSVTQKEIVEALRKYSQHTEASAALKDLADCIEREGIEPPEGYAIVPVATLKYWRELVDLNPKDLAPRIEFMLTAAKESL